MNFQLRGETTSVESPVRMEWDECDCPLCGSGRWRPWVEAPDRAAGGQGLWFMIVRCGECGLCFTNPRPSADAMRRFQPATRDEEVDHPRETATAHWWHRLPGCGNLRRFMPRHGEGRLLDVGCGNGTFVLRMCRQGWDATGLEARFELLDRLQERNIPVLAGSLNWTPLRERSYDVVTMWNGLEMERDPLEFLRRAWHLLAPGGRLVVRVPNIGCLSFHWMGTSWAGLDLPRRLTHFTPETLRLMLQRAGFGAIKTRMQRRTSWLRQSARLASRHQPHASGGASWLNGKALSNLASWYAQLTRQSDMMLVIASKNA